MKEERSIWTANMLDDVLSSRWVQAMAVLPLKLNVPINFKTNLDHFWQSRGRRVKCEGGDVVASTKVYGYESSRMRAFKARRSNGTPSFQQSNRSFEREARERVISLQRIQDPI